MAVNIQIDDFEAICALSAIETNIGNYRKFCRETDAKYGRFNDHTRDQIGVLKKTHRSLREALIERGYANLTPIIDEPIDEAPAAGSEIAA